MGQGNWAGVPWIAVLHPRETNTTQRGIYPVLLFREDLSAVEVTIAQGVTELNQTLGRRQAYVELDRRSEQLRPKLGALGELGFALDKAFELGASQLARDYVASTVVHRRFASESLLGTDVTDAVAAMLHAYAELPDRWHSRGRDAAVAPEGLPPLHAVRNKLVDATKTNSQLRIAAPRLLKSRHHSSDRAGVPIAGGIRYELAALHGHRVREGLGHQSGDGRWCEGQLSAVRTLGRLTRKLDPRSEAAYAQRK